MGFTPEERKALACVIKTLRRTVNEADQDGVITKLFAVEIYLRLKACVGVLSELVTDEAKHLLG